MPTRVLLPGRSLPVFCRHMRLAFWVQPARNRLSPESYGRVATIRNPVLQHSSDSLPQTCGRLVHERRGTCVLITPELERAVWAPPPKISILACQPTSVAMRHRVLSLTTGVLDSSASVNIVRVDVHTTCCIGRLLVAASQCSIKQVVVYPSMTPRSSESRSRSCVLTCAPPLMTGLCLLMLSPAEVDLERLTMALHG